VGELIKYEDIPRPGSDEAFYLLCICDRMDNNFGEGIEKEDGIYYEIHKLCPLHSGCYLNHLEFIARGIHRERN